MNENYVIAPESDIYLLKCPLEIDSLNQLDFASATAQYNYFQSLPKVLMDDATYVRKESRIYFEGSYDTLCTYNYCMYRNTNYSNKWFYAFVSDMRYESNNSISADLTTDVFQTWLFDIVYHRSFIERGIIPKNADLIGAYNLQEDFELGDYITNDTYWIGDLSDTMLVVGSTADYVDINVSSNGIYQNVPSGCGYYMFNLTNTGINEARNWIQTLTNNTKESAVISMFVAPKIFSTQTTITDGTKITNSYTPSQDDYSIYTETTTLDTYTPHNNKLYQYPYYFISVTNGAGGQSIIKSELWNSNKGITSTTHKFRVIGALTPGCSIIGVPLDYAGHVGEAWDESIPLGKYPSCNWSTDQYVNWQTQNGLNNSWQEFTGIAQSVTGAGQLASAIGGAVAGGGAWSEASGDIVKGGSNYFGGLYQITDAIYQRHLASLIPAQFKGNTNVGDVWNSAEQITFKFDFKSIKRDSARRIDQYFDMYGYKICLLADIHGYMTTRSNWNFIKTIDVNLTGNIPQNDLQRIKNLFNNGFTIWHDPTHFLDYTQTNS